MAGLDKIPDEITFTWLRDHLPLRVWFVLISSLIGVFMAGIGIGHWSSQISAKPDSSGREKARLAREPVKLALTAGDFALDLTEPYNGTNQVRVPVKVQVQSGLATFLRDAQVLQFHCHEYYFARAPRAPEVISVTPFFASLSPGDSEDSLIVSFDIGDLVPAGDVTARWHHGEVKRFGEVLLRLFYLDRGDTLHADVEIQCVLTKTGG